MTFSLVETAEDIEEQVNIFCKKTAARVIRAAFFIPLDTAQECALQLCIDQQPIFDKFEDGPKNSTIQGHWFANEFSGTSDVLLDRYGQAH